MSIYVNGISQASGTFSGTVWNPSRDVLIGGLLNYSTGQYGTNFTGYIDDLRITKGVARYTSNFTVPTATFPNP